MKDTLVYVADERDRLLDPEHAGADTDEFRLALAEELREARRGDIPHVFLQHTTETENVTVGQFDGQTEAFEYLLLDRHGGPLHDRTFVIGRRCAGTSRNVIRTDGGAVPPQVAEFADAFVHAHAARLPHSWRAFASRLS